MHLLPRGWVTPRLIGMVSASGGIEALEEILGSSPQAFPVPIVVVSSIHPEDVDSLAARLHAKSLLQVHVGCLRGGESCCAAQRCARIAPDSGDRSEARRPGRDRPNGPDIGASRGL
jgi:CheB methylesterase